MIDDEVRDEVRREILAQHAAAFERWADAVLDRFLQPPDAPTPNRAQRRAAERARAAS